MGAVVRFGALVDEGERRGRKMRGWAEMGEFWAVCGGDGLGDLGWILGGSWGIVRGFLGGSGGSL